MGFTFLQPICIKLVLHQLIKLSKIIIKPNHTFKPLNSTKYISLTWASYIDIRPNLYIHHTIIHACIHRQQNIYSHFFLHHFFYGMGYLEATKNNGGFSTSSIFKLYIVLNIELQKGGGIPPINDSRPYITSRAKTYQPSK